MPVQPNTPGNHAARRVQNYHYAILNLAALAEESAAAGKPVTSLNIGDPTLYGFHPPPALTEACITALREGCNSYTSSCGIATAREAISREASERRIATSAEEIIITSGATEAADLLCTAILNPGDEVLCPSPGYPLYTALVARQEAVSVPYRLDPGNNWLPDPEEIERLITPRTKLLIVINPNNPTGALYPPELLASIAETARRNNLVCLADEVYRKLLYSGSHHPFASFAGNDLPVCTLESLSKNFMVPGWRTGWMTMTNSRLIPDIRRALRKLADARVCAPAAPQFAIPEALSLGNDYLLPVLEKLRVRRDLTVRMINGIEGLSCSNPEGAFYVMAKLDMSLYPFASDEEFIVELLRKKRILFVHGSGFGMQPREGYFRIVYLPDPLTLDMVYHDLYDFLLHCRHHSGSIRQQL
ncbi:MAG: aminotransferase class I/II-fold pyridoxal phosphate-dependent enzyme [Chlorobium limicola]|uniref:pyridoxal phosphate-dependent aminotransferase n=1 Tax=Chlorobium limicola TaxID=1092 RepID=UPI0023F54F38|nr:aminotransferase class I/II-fold pyridoxal phosphate-dependent enzyme [Chlorobium limicola]NTV20508.1 aminotransferase class I/II-fold pyridoxal phosphate-dependent enzyme [Chlorobium limicola]